MNQQIDPELALELLQHEVDGVLHWFALDRRDFLKMLGGGLLVCLTNRKASAQESGGGRGGQALPQEIDAWLHIGQDGSVTVYTGKVEVGQNVRTSLAQHVAEELHVPLNTITMAMGDTALTPWDTGTVGSRSTPVMGSQLRRVAAASRELLKDLAAKTWNVTPANLIASDGQITNPATGKALTYGELTHGRKLVMIGDGVPLLSPASEWKVAGTSAPKVNSRDFVTGKHQYTSDMNRPGMLYGKVLRPEGFKATLVSLDIKQAENIPGVTLVHDRDFVAVAAPAPWTAERAVAAIKAQWNVSPQPSDKELFEYLKKNSTDGDRASQHVTGSVEQALATADVKLEQQYTVQYIAHTPLEPRAAIAEWNGDKLTVWTGTQRPFGVRDELVEAFRISPDKVRVVVPDTGSGYGGKHTGDAALEAARLAKAASKPVKLVWTREEEFTWAYFRPAGVIEARSGARRDGTLLAWEFHNYNSGPAGLATPYDIASQDVLFHPAQSPLPRQGSYRGLAATANHFARECHMDELAHALGMDALEFRLKNLTNPRLRAVFEAAAQKFGWPGHEVTPMRGCGIAGGVEKGSYVATCAEVEIDPATREVHIRRVVEAFECGAIVNPNGLRNQIEGAIVQGIGGALFEAVRFEKGRILNPHLLQYRVPRFKDAPEIEVVLLDRKDLPSAGAGETPILGVAPAVGNAIFAATGVRLRNLPMAPEGVPAS